MVLVIVLSGAWVERHTLVHASGLIRQLVQAHRLRLFAPVPSGATSAPAGMLAELRFLREISEFRAQIARRSRLFEPELAPLAKEISARQAAGKKVAYSAQIYRELRWRVGFTPDLSATRSRIAELKASLESTADQSFAEQQSSIDGSWGAGYSVWFMKLYDTVNGPLSAGVVPKYPMSFLDRINSPEALTNYLGSLVLDDFHKTGIATRMEADESVSLLGRLLCGDVKCDYPFHPQLKAAYFKFVQDWQNPETGCWGNLFRARDGGLWRMDDVGMTFHIVSRLKAETPHLDQIVRRVLQLRCTDFPAGIRVNGHYENHLNWDVVRICHYAWPTLSAATRKDAAAELARMLNWCLRESYQPDGSFKVSDLDDTFADAMQYGVSFLRDIGFFERTNRFWTDQEFPQAQLIQERVRGRLESPRSKTSELKQTRERAGKGE